MTSTGDFLTLFGDFLTLFDDFLTLTGELAAFTGDNETNTDASAALADDSVTFSTQFTCRAGVVALYFICITAQVTILSGYYTCTPRPQLFLFFWGGQSAYQTIIAGQKGDVAGGDWSKKGLTVSRIYSNIKFSQTTLVFWRGRNNDSLRVRF